MSNVAHSQFGNEGEFESLDPHMFAVAIWRLVGVDRVRYEHPDYAARQHFLPSKPKSKFDWVTARATRAHESCDRPFREDANPSGAGHDSSRERTLIREVYARAIRA